MRIAAAGKSGHVVQWGDGGGSLSTFAGVTGPTLCEE